MKQTILMIMLTLTGTVGVVFAGPFVAVAVYYLFAVLRPQFFWRWALPEGIPWSEYVAWAAILGALAQVLFHSSTGAAKHRRFAFGHLAFLMFGVWLMVTYATAINPDAAAQWTLEYLKVFVMFGVAAIVVVEARQMWALYIIATSVLVYISYELNFLYLTEGRLDIYHNGYGGLDNNGAGLMIAMGLPMTIYAWEGTHRWWRWIFAAAVPLLIHAVLMSYSRGAMVSLVIASPIVLLRSRRRWQFSAMALAIALTVPVLAGKEIRERFFSVENYDTDETANSRFESWQAAIEIAHDYPIFGVGIRNANLLSFSYGADRRRRTIHSQYLQTLADNGYPGLFLYLLAIGASWVAMVRARRALKGRTDPEALQLRSMTCGLEGALAVFCIGASFLSLEVFELPYLVSLLGIQSWVVARAGLIPAAAKVTASAPADVAAGQLQEARL